MIIPEAIFYNTFNAIKKYLIEDSNKPEKKTFLYKLFVLSKFDETEIKLDNVDYYQQSKELFKRTAGDRELKICMGYNRERKGLPSIHILLPSDRLKSMTIGNGMGFEDSQVSEGEQVEFLNNTYTGNYNFLITSDSITEVLCIYHTFKALFLAISDHFEECGLMNLNLSGMDVVLQSGMITPDIFHRSMSVNFDYEFTVPTLNAAEMKKITKITTSGTMLAPDA